jgi:NAD(P) transhydrogenase subunit alpha
MRRPVCAQCADFLKLINKEDQLVIDREDEIIKATLLCSGGELLRK